MISEINKIERERKEKQQIYKSRSNAIKNISTVCPENREEHHENLFTGNFYNSKSGLKTLLHHCFSLKEIEVANSLPIHIDELVFVRNSYLGEGKDMKDPKVKENIRKKVERKVIQYNIYRYKYDEKTWLIKLEERANGEETLYAITKKS